MKKSLLLFSLILFCLGNYCFADAPLTDTDISAAYETHVLVNTNLHADTRNNTFDFSDKVPKWITYVASDEIPLDVKIAIINKLGWKIIGDNKAKMFAEYLEFNSAKGDLYYSNERVAKIMIEKDLSKDLLICLAYMMALDDYYNMEFPLILAEKAREKNQEAKSYTVEIIYGLIQAQDAFLNNDWCGTFRATDRVRKDNTLKKDLREGAIDNIFEYMDLYKKNCSADTSEDKDGAESLKKGKDFFEKGNRKATYYWIKKSAKTGNLEGIQALGQLYLNGFGVTKDIDKGISLIEEAANKGRAEALNALGIIYQDNKFVRKDFQKAFEFYRKAAELGLPNAYLNLGMMHGQGTGTALNYAEAMKWFRKAGETGLPDGYFNMGIHYVQGWGVEQDIEEGKKWIQKAADMGSEQATEALKQLNN